MSTTKQPYDDTPHHTQLPDNISPSKLSATSRPSSTPDQTPKSTSSGSLVTQQCIVMKRQISVQRKQPNSHNTQGNHSLQLPTSRDKFNKLDFRSGNLFGKTTTGAPPTVTLQKGYHCGFLPGNQQNSQKPTKQQPPPSTNYDWDMVISDPTSYDCRITTPQDAYVLNPSKPPNTFCLDVLYIERKGKEPEY